MPHRQRLGNPWFCIFTKAQNRTSFNLVYSDHQLRVMRAGYDHAGITSTRGLLGRLPPSGANLDKFEDCLKKSLEKFNIKPEIIRPLSKVQKIFPGEPESSTDRIVRIGQKMTLGTKVRTQSRDAAIIAKYAAVEINALRASSTSRSLFVIHQLKHPEEVRFLKSVYGPLFFLVGVSEKLENQINYLTNDVNSRKAEALELIQRDQDESNSELFASDDTDDFGQKTRDTFQMSDLFVDGSEKDDTIIHALERFFDAVHGAPTINPFQSEYNMFLAQASSLRSGDLSRQVGAVVVSQRGEVCGIGVNDVPKFGGGQYWSNDAYDRRDSWLGFDANKKRLNEVLDDTLENLGSLMKENLDRKEFNAAMKKSLINDITEYGRPVHAEMSAILACARTGISTLDASLYCTTYPCHNCAKHIIASGIKEVFYIEPYPKSMASLLHRDALVDDGLEVGEDPTVFGKKIDQQKQENFVKFKPFIGIAPTRFIDLFSMKLGVGDAIKRKKKGDEGHIVAFDAASQLPRFSVALQAIIEAEGDASIDTQAFDDKVKKKENE